MLRDNYRRVIAILLVISISLCFLSGCREEKLAENLKNDFITPEFMLLGDYYELPCDIQKFVDYGWEICGAIMMDEPKFSSLDSEELKKLTLFPNEYVTVDLKPNKNKIKLNKKEFGIIVALANCSDTEKTALSCPVVAIRADGVGLKRSDADYFVVQDGVNLFTPLSKIESLYEDQKNVTIKVDAAILARNHSVTINDGEKNICRIYIVNSPSSINLFSVYAISLNGMKPLNTCVWDQ